MEIQINQKDIDEIKSKYDDISQFLIDNFVNLKAAIVVMQTIMDKVDEIEKKLKEDDNE